MSSPRTSAPRSTVVHAVRTTEARFDQYSHGTVCGRQIGDDWAGEYTEQPSGPVTCKRCIASLGTTEEGLAVTTLDYAREQNAAMSVPVGHVAVGGSWSGTYEPLPTVTLCAKGDGVPAVRSHGGKPYCAAHEYGASLALIHDTGTVRPVTHDDTGDVLADWRGCVVGVRFTLADDARAFLATDRSDRPASCGMELGGYGACVRQAAHGGMCADAHGYRFTGRRCHPAGQARVTDSMGRNLTGPMEHAEAVEAANEYEEAGIAAEVAPSPREFTDSESDEIESRSFDFLAGLVERMNLAASPSVIDSIASDVVNVLSRYGVL